ncbi:MAG: 1-hydroxycarotenoid 3,4-desaturase CrtD [Bacteroidales bacterium]
MKTAVIGSGIGGLAIAFRLAERGFNVTLFEKNSLPGGKISQISERGYRFDTGPSLFTLPSLVEEITPLKYLKLDNSCRYFFKDKSVLNFYQNHEELRKEMESKGYVDFPNVLQRFKEAEEIYNLTSNLFIFNSFHKVKNFVKPENRRIPLKLHKLGFHRTMHSANKALFKDRRIIQLFDRYATYNGSSPYRTPATLNMISHLEHNIGAFFPEKGIYSIVDEIYQKCLSVGVKFRFNTLVRGIEIDKRLKKATGITTDSGFEKFDTIISDVDVKYLSENMISPEFRYPLKNRLKQLEPSTSALIFYWGVKGSFPIFDLHNILFSSEYKKEFNHLFYKMDMFKDPTVYIFISKRVIPTDAPDGCENWFVMVNAPANIGQDWGEIIKESRSGIIKKINKFINEGVRHSESDLIDIEQLIENEHIASPVTIEKNTLSSRGALYGNSSNSMLSAFLRHPNSLSGIKNLWFVGGSVHPGGGIPLCLASAKIVENVIVEKAIIEKERIKHSNKN